MSALAGPSRHSIRRLSTSLRCRTSVRSPTAIVGSTPSRIPHRRPLHTQIHPPTIHHPGPAPTDAGLSRWTASGGSEGEGAVSFADGVISVRGVNFAPIHLRDHCRCPDCFHPITHQRLLDTYSIPRDISPSTISLGPNGLNITWSDDSHSSHYPPHLLAQLSPRSTPTPFISPNKRLWDPSTSLSSPASRPSVSHTDLTTSPTGVLEALRTIDRDGVVFIEGVPPTTEATEAVARMLGKGKLQETHYGQFWDFEADMKHGDLAYSNEPLRPHTDTTYFSTPCGLQLFHLLLPATGSGGHTLLVDAFACADQLRATHPLHHATLRDTKRTAHAAGTEGHLFRTERGYGVFEEGVEGGLEGVRWNGEDRSGFAGEEDVEGTKRWYDAIREWEGLLRREENEKWVALKAGTVVVIDNHRVMHGRSAFTGQRRMCGAYISRDDWRSHLTVLEREERKRLGGEEEGGLEY